MCPISCKLISLSYDSCCSHLSLLLEQVLSNSEMMSTSLCHVIVFGRIPGVMDIRFLKLCGLWLPLICFPVASVSNLPGMGAAWAAFADVILQPDAASCQPAPGTAPPPDKMLLVHLPASCCHMPFGFWFYFLWFQSSKPGAFGLKIQE